MFAGGEFYDDPDWIREASTISTQGMYFLNGGRACLAVISAYLRDHGIKRVLLPTYLCPSIVQTFERCGVAWDDYQVNEDLSLDLADLAQKAPNFQAVYFINYFGFFHPPVTLRFFEQLRQNGILVIEDNAHAGFSDHFTGDFVLNSIRKLAPYDGGYLLARADLRPYIERFPALPNRRLPLIREYRRDLAGYLLDGAGDYDHLVDLFERATRFYETEPVVHGDPGEREQIERLDWEGIRQARRENYAYLMEWVASIPGLTPIFPELQDDNLPMGLPVYISGGARDRVYEELGRANIGLTIHWEDLATDPRTNRNARAAEMAKRILTLPVGQSMRKKQLDYLAMQLVHTLSGVKSN